MQLFLGRARGCRHFVSLTYGPSMMFLEFMAILIEKSERIEFPAREESVYFIKKKEGEKNDSFRTE